MFLVFECFEAVAQRCSIKNVFLEILQNSQENTCVRVFFLIKTCNFSCEFFEISKNYFSYRTPPVAASVCNISTCYPLKSLLALIVLFKVIYSDGTSDYITKYDFKWCSDHSFISKVLKEIKISIIFIFCF